MNSQYTTERKFEHLLNTRPIIDKYLVKIGDILTLNKTLYLRKSECELSVRESSRVTVVDIQYNDFLKCFVAFEGNHNIVLDHFIRDIRYIKFTVNKVNCVKIAKPEYFNLKLNPIANRKIG